MRGPTSVVLLVLLSTPLLPAVSASAVLTEGWEYGFNGWSVEFWTGIHGTHPEIDCGTAHTGSCSLRFTPGNDATVSRDASIPIPEAGTMTVSTYARFSPPTYVESPATGQGENYHTTFGVEYITRAGLRDHVRHSVFVDPVWGVTIGTGTCTSSVVNAQVPLDTWVKLSLVFEPGDVTLRVEGASGQLYQEQSGCLLDTFGTLHALPADAIDRIVFDIGNGRANVRYDDIRVEVAGTDVPIPTIALN